MATAKFGIDASFEHSLDRLWDFVSYVPNQDHWVFGMSDSEIVDGRDEIGVGSEIMGTSSEGRKSWRITVKVKTFEPRRRIVWENTDGPIPFLTEIMVRGDEHSSRMRYEVTLYTKGLLWGLMMGPLRPIGNLIANKRLRDEVKHLREALDRHA